MKITFVEIENWVRRLGLATCCIVCPLVLAVIAFNWTVYRLVTAGVSNIEIPYQPAKGRPKSDRASPRSTEADGAVASRVSSKDVALIDPDPKLYLLGQHIAGRYDFSVICAFLYLICFSSFVFSGVVVIMRIGWKGLLIGIIGFGGLAYAIAGSRWIRNPFDIARPLLIDRLLNDVDKFEALRPLATKAKTGDIIVSQIAFNEFVGVVTVGIIFLALFALSLRPSDSQLALLDLRIRLKAIRCTIALGAAVLVISVILTKMLLEWPLRLIDESQSAALKPVADALTLQFGATGTIVVFSTFAPAIVAWLLDVARFRNLHVNAAQELAEEPLVLAPSSAISSILSIVAPIITSPIVDTIKAMLGVVSPN